MPRTFVAVMIAIWQMQPNLLHAVDAPSFQHEVMAVFSRTGCNMGACHGNLNGKGGFKLSLRGEDPALDHQTLTREMLGRRINPINPDQSLILRKAAGLVSHEGGVRFSIDSAEYRTLQQWIEVGLPEDFAHAAKLIRLELNQKLHLVEEDSVQLKVQAYFSDGSKRDVTTLSWFEVVNVAVARVELSGKVERLREGETVVLVRYLDHQLAARIVFLPNSKGFEFQPILERNRIDVLLNQHWQERRIQPSKQASDALFIRRVYLDLLGILPTVAETTKFLDSKTPNKYEQCIDELLKRSEFADHWALKWADLLRVEEKALDRKGVRIFHQWIRDAIHADVPLNEFASQIVTGLGSTYANPPSNFYRSIREPYARAESIAQVFLGVRIGCAKCHNHPFDAWKQEDYHQFAAIFAPIDYRVLENNRRDNLDKHEFAGLQIVFYDRTKTLKNPKNNADLLPRLLGEKQTLNEADALTHFGDWLKAPNNHYFARTQVNRVWLHLFGRGLVDPNDDFRASNPAIEPRLLDHLVEYFQQQQYSLKRLVKYIATSTVYRLDSEYMSKSEADLESHFARAKVVPLKAETLLDSILQVLQTKSRIAGYPSGTRYGQISGTVAATKRKNAQESEKFLKVFGKPERLLTCECERSEESGLIQAFHLLNGSVLQNALSDPENRFRKRLADGKPASDILNELYLAAFSRRPTDFEKAKLLESIQNSSNVDVTWEDICWAMINSKEFLLRR